MNLNQLKILLHRSLLSSIFELIRPRILSDTMAARSNALLAPIMGVNLVGSQIVAMVNFKKSQRLTLIPRGGPLRPKR